ncbi:hypothetical protein L484_022273 [Morus notabilis]|uniref:Uncharacterized protein n=1 Tax=Morus notabilis TaxID=981085 RepID=W9S650_9ROSA|nr:hypothetical protein L484_022273 [Morus notabilis]
MGIKECESGLQVTKVSSQSYSGLLDGQAEARVAEMSWVHGSGLYYARLEIKFRCKVM